MASHILVTKPLNINEWVSFLYIFAFIQSTLVNNKFSFPLGFLSFYYRVSSLRISVALLSIKPSIIVFVCSFRVKYVLLSTNAMWQNIEKFLFGSDASVVISFGIECVILFIGGLQVLIGFFDLCRRIAITYSSSWRSLQPTRQQEKRKEKKENINPLPQLIIITNRHEKAKCLLFCWEICNCARADGIICHCNRMLQIILHSIFELFIPIALNKRTLLSNIQVQLPLLCRILFRFPAVCIQNASSFVCSTCFMYIEAHSLPST